MNTKLPYIKAQYIGMAPVNDWRSPPFERFENRQVQQGLDIKKLEGCFFWTPNHENLFIVLPGQMMFKHFEVTTSPMTHSRFLYWDGNVTEPTIEDPLTTSFETWWLIRGYLRKHR